MLHRNIRDPKIALDTNYLFSHLQEFSDDDLAHAFVVYNKIRKKVESAISVPASPARNKPLVEFMKRIFNHSK